MTQGRLAIDISHLEQDHRGIGFFVREFLNHVAALDHNLTIRLVAQKDFGKNLWPFPVVHANSLDRSWLVWFPFNRPTFHPPGACVVTIHDLAPFVFPKGESKLRKAFRKGASRAKKIFVDSLFIAAEVQKFLNVPESKISPIPLGFDPTWPDAETFRPPKPYVLCVGPAEPRKNFDRLLLAFQKLKKRGFPHKLALVGDLPPWRKTLGPFVFESANPLPRLASALKLADHVVFPGVISRAELRHWYERADLVVVPSLYEGFGFPVLEAFSCQAAVACSHAASLPEVAGGGAFYFNPKDPEDMAAVLEHALTTPAAAAKKKEAAEQQLSRFTWDACARRYLDAFQSAAAG